MQMYKIYNTDSLFNETNIAADHTNIIVVTNFTYTR